MVNSGRQQYNEEKLDHGDCSADDEVSVALDTLAMQDPLIIQAKVAAAHQTVLSNDVNTCIDLVDVSQRSDLVSACTGRFT